ncbi:MAG: helix-turn-helix transcriptional regulator [Nitrospirae bacterium]|nr:helix-turn-helix transcriptional regulator [Nitrospirota bacterium]
MFTSKEEIGNFIKKARKASNMSQMELAEKVGVSYQQIQKYEKGLSEITISRLSQIAEALGIPVNSFFADEKMMVSESVMHYGKLSDEEETLIQLYRKIRSKKIRDILLIVLRKIVAQKY